LPCFGVEGAPRTIRPVVKQTPRLLQRISAEGGTLRFSDEDVSSWLELALFPDPLSAGDARRALEGYCDEQRDPRS
jgi:hypothetical protein